MGRLSGGERARVLIARLMLEPADVLLLDEPTNDLDIPTLEILEESLLDFAGALVLVTHDRYMLDRVSTVRAGPERRGRSAALRRLFAVGALAIRAEAAETQTRGASRPRSGPPKKAPVVPGELANTSPSRPHRASRASASCQEQGTGGSDRHEGWPPPGANLPRDGRGSQSSGRSIRALGGVRKRRRASPYCQ